jgi:hypothetical protein
MGDTVANTALVFMVLTLLLSARNTWLHLVYYSRPELQNHVIRIVFLVPIASVCGYLALIHPEYVLVYDSVFDFWEALVVYSFFMLILSYAGGEHVWLTYTQLHHPDGLVWPYPMHFLPVLTLDVQFMRNCKRACLQFVLVKPIMAIFNIITAIAGIYDNIIVDLVRNIVFNITYSLALYALFFLLVTMHSHPGIATKNPIAKFLTVKAMIFITFWQTYVFAVIPNSHTLAQLTVCIEMFLFALPINLIAFNWAEFRTPSLPPSIFQRTSKVIRNSFQVFSPTDVVLSTALNFAHRYDTHVLLEEPDDDLPAVSSAPPALARAEAISSITKTVLPHPPVITQESPTTNNSAEPETIGKEEKEDASQEQPAQQPAVETQV